MGCGHVKPDLLRRLKRIEGQVQGLSRMVETERYCVDILHQVRAVEAALHRVGAIILDQHLQTCVTDAFQSQDADDRRQKITELTELYGGMRPK